jgi:ring-1,2-phenylacetyl-CoA epoxidase subunit PaaD
MTVLKENTIRHILESVTDPEIPVLTITDLGIIRNIAFLTEEDCWEIQISPTYSGCPAMDMIFTQIRMTLFSHDISNFRIKQVLSPAWTTDWMSESGKEKLKAYGIAPPNQKQIVCDTELFGRDEAIQCPSCSSYHTRLVSQFGSTACKALYQCLDCKEPFDYFKCH